MPICFTLPLASTQRGQHGPPAATETRAGRGSIEKAWRDTGALRAGIIAGAICGAVFGGVGGRTVMRIIALIDESTRGAEVDFGTIDEVTVGGTFTLLVLTTIAGTIGGAIYIGVRRWLPWSGAARGVYFGLLMMFGPGVIALGEVDLQIVEPALAFFAMFVVLIVLYGVGVALVADRLHPAPQTQPSPQVKRITRAAQYLLAAGICAMAVLATYDVHDKAGSCLSADQDSGGCAVRATD